MSEQGRVIVRFTREVWCEVDLDGEPGDQIERAYSLEEGMTVAGVIVDDGTYAPLDPSDERYREAVRIADDPATGEMWPSWS